MLDIHDALTYDFVLPLLLKMVDAPPSVLGDQCFFCHKVVKTGPAPGCPGCHAVIYCSPEHQSADRPSHEAACLSIQQTQHEGDEELSKLQTKCHQCFNDKDAEPDHFWEWRDIRSFIQARHRLVVLLCKIQSEQALRIALCYSLDILRLNPGDNLDVRFLVPSIMTRLGMDQEASEFIRRYRQVSPNCQYAWAHLDMVLPEPKTEESNEDLIPAEWLDECVPLSFKAALTLLRLRLLFCLRDLEHATMLASRVPPEIVRLVRDNLVTGGVVRDSELWKEVKVGESLRDRITGLEKQLEEMFEAVKGHSRDFWMCLIQHRPFEAVDSLALGQTRDSWIETPGAVDWIQAKARAAN
jgi:hypothetical protein